MAYSFTIIEGRLTKDPELRTTTTGKEVATLTVAVDRNVPKDAEKKADFYTVTVWGKTAAFCAQYMSKGEGVMCIGTMQNDSYEKDGVKRESWKLNAERVIRPVGSKRADSSAIESAPAPAFTETEDVGDLPF